MEFLAALLGAAGIALLLKFQWQQSFPFNQGASL